MIDYNDLKIVETEFWSVYLHQDQTVIGRMYFWYKGEIRDLMNIPSKAFIDMFTLGKKMKAVLDKLFQPDMYNYLVLSNKTPHLKFHMIPRYSKPRKILGIIFKDDSFGKSYTKNSNFILIDVKLLQIAGVIRRALS